jgi:sulfatase maturation enzyme AslB (radical SAM superfamily)
MANLSITNVCNRKCVYCFANDTRNEFGKTLMDDETFEKALEYLRRSDIKQTRLLGGEPTLHPEFIQFIKRALEQDFGISLFTNGLMTEEVSAFLQTIPEGKLSILLNTIHPSENDGPGIERQKEMMKKLGSFTIAGINIYSARQEMDYLLEYVSKYNLKKEIRLGISHSVLSRNNISLHPGDYQKIGHEIVKLKQHAIKEGVSLGFDCGFVPCMFPVESNDLLSEELKKAGTCCHPVIDLLSDGSFIACYPLNNFLKIKINDHLHAKGLIESFEEALMPYNEAGIYPYCTTCPLFKKRCNGGCMSFRIQRFSGYVPENA